ncbi:GNAT family N-acetyltransferase [Ulvibacter antarcticus]|uniref:Acetyltransferase (GNAT) family protein n=1 Tax=Ulvibacter antarcticus TaxID=442714 RepID=A0A3L9Z2P0_9FLAO|nr:GNAT family N-acetyltransferase [Ulvibacter antarcticus]RMA66410.1 acetyltransferase (GNAT) family protein [Ulvibacter antarcticus]
MVAKVRIAKVKDLPILLEFEQGVIAAERSMDPTLKKEKISYYDIGELIKASSSEVYVAEINEEIVASGYVKMVEAKPYLDHKYQGYLGFMFVPKEHRGKGLNKMILDALINWCKKRNVTEIRLDVYNDNPPAIRAYEKAGFKPHLINMRLSIDD